jgi:hypothetical protein
VILLQCVTIVPHGDVQEEGIDAAHDALVKVPLKTQLLQLRVWAMGIHDCQNGTVVAEYAVTLFQCGTAVHQGAVQPAGATGVQD